MSDPELRDAIGTANRAHFVEFVEIGSRQPVFVRPEFVAAIEPRHESLGGVRITLSGGRNVVVCGTAPVIAKTLEIASLKAGMMRDESETP